MSGAKEGALSVGRSPHCTAVSCSLGDACVFTSSVGLICTVSIVCKACQAFLKSSSSMACQCAFCRAQPPLTCSELRLGRHLCVRGLTWVWRGFRTVSVIVYTVCQCALRRAQPPLNCSELRLGRHLRLHTHRRQHGVGTDSVCLTGSLPPQGC